MEDAKIALLENGIIEPIVVKEQAIKSASESAAMILRVDDIITDKSPKGGSGGPGSVGDEQMSPLR